MNRTCPAPVGVALQALLTELRRRDYAFTTVTPSTHQRVLDRDAAAQDLRDVLGWNKPFAPELLPDALFQLLYAAGLLTKGREGWRSDVRVACLGDDLLVHSAFPTTGTDAVFFGPDTYRFARAIRHHLQNKSGENVGRVVDIGCGAGAGGMVVARCARYEELVLIDINDTALSYARANVAFAGLPNVATLHSDLLSQVDGDFDLIIANPPYLNDPLGRTYRNGGGTLGSALSVSIAKTALTRLTPGGTLLLYTGSPIVGGVDHLRNDITAAFRGSPLQWSYDEIDPDVFGEELDTPAYADADRIAAVVLTARRTGDV